MHCQNKHDVTTEEEQDYDYYFAEEHIAKINNGFKASTVHCSQKIDPLKLTEEEVWMLDMEKTLRKMESG